MTKNKADIPEDRDFPSEDGTAVNDPVAAGSDENDHLRESLNSRISYLCRLAALIIAVITFATTILGQDDMSFVILGLSLSVALLAIAGLQNHMTPKR